MINPRVRVLCLMVLFVALPSTAQDTDKRRAELLNKTTLERVKMKDGFEYLSGYLPTSGGGNFPTMYAHGPGETKITVIGRGFVREYSIREWGKAVQAFHALLIVNGYEVPPKIAGGP